MENSAFDLYAASALQALIAKLPLMDRDGEFSVPKSQEDIDKVKTDIARSALAYAHLMMQHRKDFTETP